jgi:hypothetical protein
VSSGTTPTISWTGGIANAYYIQEAGQANSVTALEMWSFGACANIFDPTCKSTDGFASPVKYGVLPAAGVCGNPLTLVVGPAPVYGVGGTQCPTAKALRSGTTYIIVIDRIDGRIGARYFTP